MTSKHPTRTLLTIVTEAVLEATLIRNIERLGAAGYTITDARGKGSRGARNAGWEHAGNIRVEIVCDGETAEAIASHMQEKYYSNYAMILIMSEVQVLRADKF